MQVLEEGRVRINCVFEALEVEELIDVLSIGNVIRRKTPLTHIPLHRLSFHNLSFLTVEKKCWFQITSNVH